MERIREEQPIKLMAGGMKIEKRDEKLGQTNLKRQSAKR